MSLTQSSRRPVLAAVLMLLVAVAVLAPASRAVAAITTFTATLQGSQEVPPNGSGGTGTGSVSYDDTTGVLSWTITFSGLTGPATLAHYHGPAAIGANAGVQVDIGAISGLTSPMVGSTTITPTQASQLLAGLWYINIHTSANPGGELRGQVQALQTQVPTLGTMGLGVLFLTLLSAGGWMLRRRRQS